MKKYTDRDLLSFLWSFVILEKKNLFYTIFLLIVSTILSIIAPLYFQNGLTIIQNLNDKIIGKNNIALNSLIIAMSAYFVISVLSWVSHASQFVFTAKLNANVIKHMRINTFRKLLKNKVSFYDNNESGVLTSNLTNDINELYDTGNSFAYVLTSFVRLIGVLGILFYFSIPLTLTAVGFLPIFFIIAISIRRVQRNYENEWRKKFGKVNQTFSENMRSISVSKAFNREGKNLERFNILNEATYQASIKRGLAIFISGPIGDFLRHVLLIAILAVGTWQTEQGNLTVATFYLFVFVLDYYYDPVMSLASNYTRFQSLFVNLERVLNISDNPDLKENNIGTLSADHLKGKLEFHNVDFSYNKDNPVLKNINFTVEPGQRIALVGHTGAGKSTIASLLLRFYEIDNGRILLDNKNIKDYNLNSLRQNLSLVSQRVLLFKGTIRENLTIAKSDASDTDIWNALDAVQARDFIEELPDSLETKVVEGGKNLSAGQRQMISFARALLSNPKLIILDEATSAVDLYTESRIQEATDLLLENRTSVVIAHRLTTILRSDIIAVLENGELKQLGTHNDLLNQEGPYKEMYQLYFETQSAKYLEKIKEISQ